MKKEKMIYEATAIYEVAVTTKVAELLYYLGDYVYKYGAHDLPKLLITHKNNGKIYIEYANPGQSKLQKFNFNKSDLQEFFSLNAKAVTTLICNR